jgi:hypothetical protein
MMPGVVPVKSLILAALVLSAILYLIEWLRGLWWQVGRVAGLPKRSVRIVLHAAQSMLRSAFANVRTPGTV